MNLPLYCQARQIRALIAPISAKALRRWARKGLIRIAKLGCSRQSQTLYRSEDVLALLEGAAQAGTPVMRSGVGPA